jgi:DNA-binding NarL/FixJ family response regulator
MRAQPYRVVLIENHPLLMDGLLDAIAEAGDLAVVGTARDADEGFQVALREKPDLVLVNMGVSGRGAFVLAGDLAEQLPLARVVFLSEFYSDILLDEAMRLNVKGFLLTNEPANLVIVGLRRVCQGDTAFSAEIENRLVYDQELGRHAALYQNRLSKLTARQLMVLRHLSWGTNVDDVARDLSISRHTVHSHKSAIMRKLDIHDPMELMRYAIREGLAVP